MFTPQREVYPEEVNQVIIVYDVRIPGVEERFRRERLALGEDGDVEMLDLDHPVLIIRPGGALRLTA